LKNKKDSARSSQLTGGEGFTYEDVIAAYFLAALLREEAALAQPGRVTRVAVQQDRQGEPMDDVIVDSDAAGERYRLSLQVKRSVTVSASNADFQNIITKAVETCAKSGFRRGLDRYGFIARAVGEDRFQSLQRIIERAKASTTGAEFDARFRAGGESSKADIALRNELAGLIKPADAAAEAAFYRDFVAHRLDGFEPGDDRFTDLRNRLTTISANADGSGLADILCRQVRLGEGAAKVWTRPSLIVDLRTLHPLTVAPTYADDTRILQEAARHAIADIRSDIGGVEIARDRLLETAERAVDSHVFSNISGLPGCGKSVVLKRYAERAMAAGPILLLKSDRLQGTSWRTYANALGLRHQSEVEILAELGAGGAAILFIDGIDRIKQEERGIVTDLLRAIETEKALSHWRILVTSRDQGLEVLRSWIPSSLYAATGVGNVAVGTLDEGEAEALAAQRPELHALLFGPPACRRLQGGHSLPRCWPIRPRPWGSIPTLRRRPKAS
jgi:ATPase family associated with various cellular activities (AAA)